MDNFNILQQNERVVSLIENNLYTSKSDAYYGQLGIANTCLQKYAKTSCFCLHCVHQIEQDIIDSSKISLYGSKIDDIKNIHYPRMYGKYKYTKSN